MLSEEHKLHVEKMGWKEALQITGIAGIRDFTSVKCLHCHYAHFLARPAHGNVIGEWVHELLLEYALVTGIRSPLISIFEGEKLRTFEGGKTEDV